MTVADSHFLLANARIVDFPVVYCNEGLCQLTGFERSDLMQKPAVCSAMHGEQTTPESITRLQNAMEQQISDQFEIQLYKKNSKVSLYFSISLLLCFCCRRLTAERILFPGCPCPFVCDHTERL